MFHSAYHKHPITFILFPDNITTFQYQKPGKIMVFTETNYENSILELLQQDLGYHILYGPDIERDYKNPLLEDELTPAITKHSQTTCKTESQ